MPEQFVGISHLVFYVTLKHLSKVKTKIFLEVMVESS
jgi:hypothetical protein